MNRGKKRHSHAQYRLKSMNLNIIYKLLVCCGSKWFKSRNYAQYCCSETYWWHIEMQKFLTKSKVFLAKYPERSWELMTAFGISLYPSRVTRFVFLPSRTTPPSSEPFMTRTCGACPRTSATWSYNYPTRVHWGNRLTQCQRWCLTPRTICHSSWIWSWGLEDGIFLFFFHLTCPQSCTDQFMRPWTLVIGLDDLTYWEILLFFLYITCGYHRGYPHFSL